MIQRGGWWWGGQGRVVVVVTYPPPPLKCNHSGSHSKYHTCRADILYLAAWQPLAYIWQPLGCWGTGGSTSTTNLVRPGSTAEASADPPQQPLLCRRVRYVVICRPISRYIFISVLNGSSLSHAAAADPSRNLFKIGSKIDLDFSLTFGPEKMEPKWEAKIRPKSIQNLIIVVN